MTQTIQTSKQQKILVKLLSNDYSIEYKPGNPNKIADALSCKPDHHNAVESTYLDI